MIKLDIKHVVELLTIPLESWEITTERPGIKCSWADLIKGEKCDLVFAFDRGSFEAEIG